MLFAGTGHGFFYSLDDGGRWTQFKDGLPAAPVTWIVVPKLAHDVVISTYGRGLFILNDITRLEVLEGIDCDRSAARTEFSRVMDQDVPAFNRSASAAGLAPLRPDR
ncbi:MAG: hypothetical protein HY048_19705 [Acidobacteria bacterium]|nr:hypothetical protein [Acidobacteriota bacterium]